MSPSPGSSASAMLVAAFAAGLAASEAGRRLLALSLEKNQSKKQTSPGNRRVRWGRKEAPGGGDEDASASSSSGRQSATTTSSTSTSTSTLLLPWRHASEPPSDATERPPLPDVPFSVYAADRLLGSCGDEEGEGHGEAAVACPAATSKPPKPRTGVTRTRRALETLAALYLRADAAGLADGLVSLGLEPLLVAAARLERLLVGTAAAAEGKGAAATAADGSAGATAAGAKANKLPPLPPPPSSSSSSSPPSSPCCVADRLPPSVLEAAVAAELANFDGKGGRDGGGESSSSADPASPTEAAEGSNCRSSLSLSARALRRSLLPPAPAHVSVPNRNRRDARHVFSKASCSSAAEKANGEKVNDADGDAEENDDRNENDEEEAALARVAGALMAELERLLLDYLGCNWDCLDSVVAANAADARRRGLLNSGGGGRGGGLPPFPPNWASSNGGGGGSSSEAPQQLSSSSSSSSAFPCLPLLGHRRRSASVGELPSLAAAAAAAELSAAGGLGPGPGQAPRSVVREQRWQQRQGDLFVAGASSNGGANAAAAVDAWPPPAFDADAGSRGPSEAARAAAERAVVALDIGAGTAGGAGGGSGGALPSSSSSSSPSSSLPRAPSPFSSTPSSSKSGGLLKNPSVAAAVPAAAATTTTRLLKANNNFQMKRRSGGGGVNGGAGSGGGPVTLSGSPFSPSLPGFGPFRGGAAAGSKGGGRHRVTRDMLGARRRFLSLEEAFFDKPAAAAVAAVDAADAAGGPEKGGEEKAPTTMPRAASETTFSPQSAPPPPQSTSDDADDDEDDDDDDEKANEEDEEEEEETFSTPLAAPPPPLPPPPARRRRPASAGNHNRSPPLRTPQPQDSSLSSPERLLSPPPARPRPPVLLLLGGGMAAGKSTVREVVARDDLWALTRLTAAAPPVVIEADAIKATAAAARAAAERVARRAKEEAEEGGGGGEGGRGGGGEGGRGGGGEGGSRRGSRGEEGEEEEEEERLLGRFVHEYSTRAAEELLVNAVNEQRDVVFDGTMAWLPFVRATIAMVRDHAWLYRRGPGWQGASGGGGKAEKEKTKTMKKEGDADGENSEESSSDDADDADADASVYWQRTSPAPASHLPYRVEVVGVTCDPGLAVARGVWRRLRSGRCVPVAEQLRSHRLFAAGFPAAAALADSATLFHTGSALTTLGKAAADLAPVVIAHRSAATRGEMLVSPRAWARFAAAAGLNDAASSAACLWKTTKATKKGKKKEGEEGPVLPPQLFPQQMQMQQAAPAGLCAPRAGTLLAVLRAADRRELRSGSGSAKEKEKEEEREKDKSLRPC